MWKIMIVCNNGCSSSVLVRHLQKELSTLHPRNDVKFFCQDFVTMKTTAQSCDLIMLCPQTYLEVLNLKPSELPSAPIYLIPPKIFVTMPLQVLLEDAQDILMHTNSDFRGVFHFPNEADHRKIRRDTSYREWKKHHE